jgi:hypothetical protein
LLEELVLEGLTLASPSVEFRALEAAPRRRVSPEDMVAWSL